MSMPFINQEFVFTQPDGTPLKVRGTGDQYHAVFETLDGYTVIQDPVSGFYHYATLGPQGDELVPLGVRADAVKPSQLGLEKSLRAAAPAARATSPLASGLARTPSRWEVRRHQKRMSLQAASRDIAPAPPQRKTVGKYAGLCLLVQFPDVKGTISRENVEAFCNKKNYSGYGNNGSVRDYYLDVSDGRLDYSNLVLPYYTSRYRRDYYTNEKIPQPKRAVELIKEVLSYYLKQGFDFGQLTSDDGDYVYAINVFYVGTRVNNWAKGLWPHSYHLDTPLKLAAGKLAYDYQITDMTDELTLGTFCHENGHMICDFPDLYDYGYESNGIGEFCLMCAGGHADPKNPAQIGAYLKNAAGWGSVVTMTPGQGVKLRAGANEFALWRKSATEYFIVENRQRAKRDAALPDAGLAVWHVDELGSNSNEQMSPSQHYECALVQADGRNDLEKKSNNGDASDLFRATQYDKFSDKTQPNSNWWDATKSGLEMTSISPAGSVMSFSVAGAVVNIAENEVGPAADQRAARPKRTKRSSAAQTRV
jgi:M6 family metalloprotease-like protein